MYNWDYLLRGIGSNLFSKDIYVRVSRTKIKNKITIKKKITKINKKEIIHKRTSKIKTTKINVFFMRCPWGN